MEQLSEDGLACVFDVPEEYMEAVRQVCDMEDWLDICTELPTLKVSIRPTYYTCVYTGKQAYQYVFC